MADEKVEVDGRALASVLLDAKMRLEDAVAHLRSPGAASLRLKRALEDNNSTCNTACSCGALAERVQLGRE